MTTSQLTRATEASHFQVSEKALAKRMFTKDGPESSSYTCKCGTKTVLRGSGYTNLSSHVLRAHPELVRNAEKSATDAFELYSKKAVQIDAWVSIVVDALLSFHVCKSEAFRRFARSSPLSTKTLVAHLGNVAKNIEEKIEKRLPDYFCWILDGRSNGSTHYVAVFATFEYSTSILGWSRALFSFSPMGEEETLGANEHYNFLEFFLAIYEKSWKNVVALVGDNCSTNEAVARKAGKIFLGCASHRFNLATEDILANYSYVAGLIHRPVSKLSNPIPSAKLKKLTHLRPKLSNITRWSSTFYMLKRYQELRPVLPAMKLDVVDDLMPTTRQDRKIDRLLLRPEDLDSVTKKLQEVGTTMCDVRSLFDAVMEQYPETSNRLSPSAEIVCEPVFEAAVCKVLAENGDMRAEERECLKILERTSVQEVVEVGTHDSLAERALKRYRSEAYTVKDKYLDLRFILPTSNVCERIFSQTGRALTDLRKSLLPLNFES